MRLSMQNSLNCQVRQRLISLKQRRNSRKFNLEKSGEENDGEERKHCLTEKEEGITESVKSINAIFVQACFKPMASLAFWRGKV